MGPVVSTDKLEGEAAAWLVRCESPHCTAEDRESLEEWLATSPHHLAVYTRLRAAWGQAEQFRRLRPLDATVNENLLTETILPSLRRADRPPKRDFASTARRYLLTAAAGVMLLSAFAFLGHALLKRFGWHSYITGVGGFERVALPDGSTVHMNTNSKIRVRFTKSRREVMLDRGEALFTVASHQQRPFDVEARGTLIRARGTVFAVRLRAAQTIEVVVTEGRVTIDSPERESRRSAALAAGETVTISAHRLRVAKINAVESKRKTAWMSGQLLFEEQTLAEMATEFNRYNRRQLVIADPAIAQLRMSAGFDATDPESFVAALERSYGVRALRTGAGDAQVVRLMAGEKQ